MPLVDQPPIVTLYRDAGIVQFNKAGTLLIEPTQHEGVDLLVPVTQHKPWKIDRRPGSPSNLVYNFGRPARFRAARRLALFFAEQEATCKVVRLALVADPEFSGLFLLRPLHKAARKLNETKPDV